MSTSLLLYECRYAECHYSECHGAAKGTLPVLQKKKVFFQLLLVKGAALP